MFTVQTYDKIASIGLDLFPSDHYQVTTDSESPDAYLVRSYKLHDQVLPDSLKAIARAGAGVNNIPINACSERGIVVFNTPGANANGVKELVLAGLLLSSRRIVQGISWAQTLKGQGDTVPGLIEKGKKNFAGPEILGKTLGVIGLGAIGLSVANDALALGMNVIGYDPFLTVDFALALSPNVKRTASLDALIASSDYITLHVPLNDQTRNLIDARRCAMMKPGARLLNFARGELVDQEAVLQGLESGALSAYVTDFVDDSLLGNDKVIPIPHLGASTPEAEDNCAIMAVNQLREYLEHGNITNSVNFPACSLPYPSKGCRLVIATNSEASHVGQITSLLENHSISISDMLNRANSHIAYNIIDVSCEVDDNILNALKAIEGVIMVRSLKAEKAPAY